MNDDQDQPEQPRREWNELQRLLDQRLALDEKIDDVRRRARGSAIAQARLLIYKFDLTAEDVFGSDDKKASVKREPKYRNPATGEVWSGIGRAPLWYRQAENKEALKVGPNNPLTFDFE